MNPLDSIFHWILDGSLRASALAVAVLLVRRLTTNRLSARWRYALWLPVLAALVLPAIPILPAPSLPAPVTRESPPVKPMAPEAVTSDSATPSPARPSEMLMPPEVRLDTRVVAGQPEASQPMPPPAKKDAASPGLSAPAATPPPSPAPFPWRKLLTAGWLAGFLLTAGVVGSSYLLSLRRIRRSAVPVPPELRDRIALLAQSLGLRRVPKVLLSPDVASPAVGGWWRPVLLLNATFPADLTEEEADMVLRHELTHIRRGDLVLNPLLCGLLALHWFNPLLWLAYSRVRADREAACDADVLRDANDARRAAYGKTLLKMETAFPPSGMCLGFVGILQRGSALRDRIQSIIARPKPGLLLRTSLALGIIGLAVLGLAKADEARKFVTPAEFKQHFARVGMAETMHHTEFLGITNGVAEIKVSDMNPLTRKWNERRLAVEVEKLDPDFRAEVEKAKPPKAPPPFSGRGDWGEEIQGLSCRITPEKPEYEMGEPVRLLVEIRNSGDETVRLAEDGKLRLEITRSRGSSYHGRNLPFPADVPPNQMAIGIVGKSTISNIVNYDWGQADWEAEGHRGPFQTLVGEYRVKASLDLTQGFRSIQPVCKEVTINVVPKKAADAVAKLPDDNILRDWLAKADCVVSGRIASEPGKVSKETGIYSYNFDFLPSRVLKGEALQVGIPAPISIVRHEPLHVVPLPISLGREYLLFLKKAPPGGRPFVPVEFPFGVQPMGDGLTDALVRIAQSNPLAMFPGRGDWGLEVQGLSCRITPGKTEYQDGEAIRVLVEIRNTSDKPLALAFEPRADTEEGHKLGGPREDAGVKFVFMQETPRHVSAQLGWFPKPLSPATHATLLKADGTLAPPITGNVGADQALGSFVLGPNETYSEIHPTTVGWSATNVNTGEIQPAAPILSAEIGLPATGDHGQITLKSKPVGISFKQANTITLPFGMAATMPTGDKTESSVTLSTSGKTLRTFTISKKDLGAPISKDDPIYSTLEGYQKAVFMSYDKGKSILPSFSGWYALESAAAKRLFPKLRFARIAWDEDIHPEAKGNVIGRAAGLVKIVGADTTTNRIHVELWDSGNYEAFGSLLAKNRIHLRNADDAKVIWQAFCDLHDKRWHDYPSENMADGLWHLGNCTHEEARYFYEVHLDKEQMVKSAELKSEKVSEPEKATSLPQAFELPAFEGRGEWGDEVAGLSCRITTEKTEYEIVESTDTSLKRGGPVRILVEIRNNTDKVVTLGLKPHPAAEPSWHMIFSQGFAPAKLDGEMQTLIPLANPGEFITQMVRPFPYAKNLEVREVTVEPMTTMKAIHSIDPWVPHFNSNGPLKPGKMHLSAALWQYLTPDGTKTVLPFKPVEFTVKSKKEGANSDTPAANPPLAKDDAAYRAITQNILTKVAALKGQFPILEKMQVPEVAANGEATLEFEHGVQWVLDDPTQKASKTNARRAVFQKDGLHFRLHFYRGRWRGAAAFIPVNFGDLNLWFTYGYRQGDDPAIIAAISKIMEEEKKKFDTQTKRIVDSVYVLPNGYRGPVFVAQAPEVLPDVAERQKNTLMVTTVDEKGEGVTVGAIKPISGWEYRESAKQRDGVKIKTADDNPADDEVAWRQIAGYGRWKRAYRPEGFAAYYVGTKADAEKFQTELEGLVNLYTDEEALAFRAKLGSLKYPTTTQAACEALGIDIKRLTHKDGLMMSSIDGRVGQSVARVSPNYSISFQFQVYLQGADGKMVQNDKGEIDNVSIFTRVEVREVHKKEDKVEIFVIGDTLFVDVTSPSGIGGTRLALTSGEWMKKVVVRLKYAADKPFSMLEGPEATLEELEARHDLAAIHLNVRHFEKKDGFEADLPIGVQQKGSKVLYLHWIDAYRN